MDSQEAIEILKGTVIDWRYISAYEALRRLVVIHSEDVVLAAIRPTPLEADAARPGEAEQLEPLAAQLKHEG